jgi:hypothetical protein
MKSATAELTGRALDYAVALAAGYAPQVHHSSDRLRITWANPRPGTPCPALSTDWAQGGPIIERDGICSQFNGAQAQDWARWLAWLPGMHVRFYGPTPLVAAMRCYVASKLGDTVEIPEALCKPLT